MTGQTDDLSAFLDTQAFILPNLSDTFAYACADTEQISVGCGPVMAEWWRRYDWHGLVALAAWKRGRHPLPSVASHPSYTAAVDALRSDEQLDFEGDGGERWVWWFELDDAKGLT